MYVVTGGAGFIGSNIVWALETRGLGPVAVCDRLGDDGKRPNIAKRSLAEVVAPGDLLAYLEDHRADVEAVFHMGAVSATTATDAERVMEANFNTPLVIWKWCAEHRVRLIYASSAATYGDGRHGFDDDGSPDALARLRPLNLYGWSKHLFDRRVARMVADGDPAPPQWAGLKFFNVFGPNEYHKGPQQSVVAQIYAKAAAGGPAILFESHHPDYPDGGQLRDFIWIDDCIDVVLWLLDNPSVSGLFNCGTGRARSFADLAGAVFAALDMKPNIAYVPTPEVIRDKYQYFTEARMDRLRAAGFGNNPMTLEDGVAAYVRQYLHTNDAYR